MIVGDPAVFAIESSITQAYEEPNFMAVGPFLVHVGGRCYGERVDDAESLDFPWHDAGERIARRGRHSIRLGAEVSANAIAFASRQTYYEFENEIGIDLGVPLDDVHKDIISHRIEWRVSEAFDDGSHVLNFDHGDRVRVVAYKNSEHEEHVLDTLSEVWLDADEFYGILDEWHRRLYEEWEAAPKLLDQLAEIRRRVSAHIDRHSAALGLQRVCPFVLEDAEGRVEFAAYLPQFGVPHGIVIDVYLPLGESSRHRRVGERSGFYYNCINEERASDEGLFIEWLRKCGFFGRPEDLRPEVLELVTRPSPWAEP